MPDRRDGEARGDQDSGDPIASILDSPELRFLVLHLKRKGGRLETSFLGDELAAWREDTAVDEISPRTRKKHHIAFYHSYLKQLDDADFIRFHQDTKEIELTETGDRFAKTILGARTERNLEGMSSTDPESVVDREEGVVKKNLGVLTLVLPTSTGVVAVGVFLTNGFVEQLATILMPLLISILLGVLLLQRSRNLSNGREKAPSEVIERRNWSEKEV
jgi:hypothetical protein